MKDYKKKLANYLTEHHPGIPKNNDIAMELVESMLVSMRKFLLSEGELHLDGIGKLEIKRFSGTEKKRDARYNVEYKVTPRNVLKLTVSDNFKKLININREPSEKIEK